jgi:RHS repeat-associated protein
MGSVLVADAVSLTPSDGADQPFSWTATLPQAGSYEVYARWPADDGRTAAASYAIAHELGSSTVTVNQRANGGQWVLLGSYDFDPANANAEVTLDGFADGGVAADAVRFVESGGAPLEVSYLHSDQLGRPQIITDSAALVSWDRTQTPFGETVTTSGSDSTALRFPGQYADGETGLSYNYFRDYDPSLGRYVESDPIGLIGGLNTFAYVGGNPLTRIDPKGQALVSNPLSSSSTTNPQSNASPTGDVQLCYSGKDREEYDEQYERDVFECSMLGLASCYAQAMVRYSACTRGDEIPPLNY